MEESVKFYILKHISLSLNMISECYFYLYFAFDMARYSAFLCVPCQFGRFEGHFSAIHVISGVSAGQPQSWEVGQE